ncbi:response regulator transcription factor [Oceanibacterium hippocampi]|uniref:Alkaline phosphatase synthesis transcriptional regulatory protein PhoP n=1 Tax=Oceanibacterium hippocampi TaxID=745714 RepID=A0A1Y5TYH1_9PROT|nr:response regulator [Oceanibacterium hippocampi]SLN75807.1 Alkaline phosphatase synthesis transcriptional regulatory protein PhoP [Oceanibacterium hippocampi]
MPGRVLIVEDEPNIVESLTFLLSREGFDVTSHGNGVTAFDALLVDPPDVLVLDVMLPGLNGFDLLRRLRGNPALASLPVLMLTAKGQKRDREVAEACGANLFMIKPFSNADVVAAVKRLAG